MRPPHALLRMLAVALTVSAVLAVPAAQAKRQTLEPAKERRGVATFKLDRVAPAEIRSVRLKVGRRTRALSVRAVRRAAERGVLRVRISRSRSSRSRSSRSRRSRSSRPRSSRQRSLRRRGAETSKRRRPKTVELIVVTEPEPEPEPTTTEPAPTEPATTEPTTTEPTTTEPAPTSPDSGPTPAPITSWRAVGSGPLSDAEAAARVSRSTYEHRSGNASANRYRPSDAELLSFYGAKDRFGRTREQYNRYLASVTGRPGISYPTTDELIQWTAHKWGIPEDLVRAQMAAESWWSQAQMGDRRTGVDASLYPAHSRIDATTVWESLGISQVKWRVAHNGLNEVHPGTEPLRWRSTAFALDYYAATVRYYYDGLCDWCGSAYRAGDAWNSVGMWYSGQWAVNVSAYIDRVQRLLADRVWAQPTF